MNPRKTTRWTATVPFLIAVFLAGAGILPAQESAPARKDEQAKKAAADKKRTFNDTDLEKYKTKGNISQSTLGGTPKGGAAGKTGTPAAKASPYDRLFKPGLGQKDEQLKAETVAACEEREKASRACAPYQDRWVGLNKSLDKARNAGEKLKIRDQIRALEKEMEPAVVAKNKAEQRYQQCMDKAAQAGILSPQADAQYKSAAKERAAVATSGR